MYVLLELQQGWVPRLAIRLKNQGSLSKPRNIWAVQFFRREEAEIWTALLCLLFFGRPVDSFWDLVFFDSVSNMLKLGL